MTKLISKITTKTVTQGNQYTVIKKTKLTVGILNDNKEIEYFKKQELKKYFDV